MGIFQHGNDSVAFGLPIGQVCAGRLTALSHVSSSVESPDDFGERFVYAKNTWVFLGVNKGWVKLQG